MMRVIQLLPTISYGDAVGNDTLTIRDILCEMGFETDIYAENIAPRLPAGMAKPFNCFPALADEDVIIYHGSTGSAITDRLPGLRGRKMMIYHNITPPVYFHPYSRAAEKLTRGGMKGIRGLADTLEYCIADSQYNRKSLLRMGYTCRIDVCPILIPFSDYEKKPSEEILRNYNDGYTNILFVGRLAPNKKQDDIIRIFSRYRSAYNAKSRLILCGSWGGMEAYLEKLRALAAELGVADSVIFTGHVKFSDILAYYRIAHVFLCMSAHEGFCVPLVEAMYFGVPIVAYDSSAIAETLGKSGILLQSRNLEQAAQSIDQLVRIPGFAQKIVADEKTRLEAFSYERVRAIFRRQLSEFIGGNNA